MTWLGIAGGQSPSAGHIAGMFLVEVAGGVALGLAAGYGAYRLLKSIDNYQVEVLITLALVFGGYALAPRLHVSGPITMVVAGLLIGNQGRRLAMSPKVREHLDTFWELVDEILNAMLFVMIGLEVLVVALDGRRLLAGALAIPVALLARFICVGAPTQLLSGKSLLVSGTVRVLTWGGLRGGISVALALSLPNNSQSKTLLTMTYVVVAFSILVQGMTIGPLVRSEKTLKAEQQ